MPLKRPPYEPGGTSKVTGTQDGVEVGDYQQALCYDEEAW
jgi:hypothetical protein